MTENLKTLAADVINLHQQFTEAWHTDPAANLIDGTELMALVVRQHKYNFDLWHEEDKAREPGAADSTIAQVKRNIDQLNQNRNDTITLIDEALQDAYFASKQPTDHLPWNSETIGSIIDRLSIAELKVYHMREQTLRDDADAEHINTCQRKTEQLEIQQGDLSIALQQFVDDILAGEKQNKLYRQFKMYNDPTLNPKIYAQQATE